MNTSQKLLGFRIGQIRRAIMNDGSAELVVINKVNPLSATCDVFLLDFTTDAASVRDFITSPTAKDEFAVTIMPDYSGNLENALLVDSPVFGQLCMFCITELTRNGEMHSDQTIAFPYDHECFLRGDGAHLLLSNEWSYRTAIYRKFSEACNQYLDAETFFSIREFMLVYSRGTSLKAVSESLPKGSSLEDLNKSLKSNPYARMLVRC